MLPVDGPEAAAHIGLALLNNISPIHVLPTTGKAVVRVATKTYLVVLSEATPPRERAMCVIVEELPMEGMGELG